MSVVKFFTREQPEYPYNRYDPSYDEDYDDEDRDDEGFSDRQHAWTELRMARWFASLLAGALAVGAWMLIPSLDSLAPLFPWMRDHYPWSLLPLIWFLLFLAIRAYVEIANLASDDGEWTDLACVGAGLVSAILVASEWDGQTQLFRSAVRPFPGGLFGLLSVSVVFLLAMAMLRRANYSDWDGFELVFAAGAIFALLVVTPPIYVLGHAAWTQIQWREHWGSIADAAPEYWAPVAVTILVVAQSPGWRRYWIRRTHAYSREGDYTQGSAIPRLVAGGLTLGLLVAVVLYQLPELLVPRADLTAAEYADSITQERRTLLAVMGALGAGVTLVYTHLRHQLDRDANATGRYTEAVQQLGNESMSIRLGGIYALARVARDSPGDRQTVTEVLAAFVRDGTRTASVGVALDVMAALTELGRTQTRGEDEYDEYDYYGEWQSVNLRSSNFSGGNLESFRFPNGVDLSESDLSGALLRATTVRRASFYGANLTETDFRNAELYQCLMVEARSQGAIYQEAQMAWARASGADFSGADFKKAVLVGADLQESIFRGADLTGADLTGADLRGADLTGARMKGTRVDRALIYGTVLSQEAMLDAEGASRAIDADIRVDIDAQKVYAKWRANEGGRRGYGGRDEYRRDYEPRELHYRRKRHARGVFGDLAN